MPIRDQGILFDRYKVIPRTLIFITQPGQVLLLKGSSNKKLWANLFNGIGGHIERGEDPLSAARRELFEESGLQVHNLVLSGTILIDTGESIGIAIYLYRGEYSGGTLSAGNEGQLEWIPIPDLDQLALVEDLRIILPRLLQMAPGDPAFSAIYDYDSKGEINIRFG